MDLVCTAEITNIRVKVCEFQLQITTFYVQRDFLFA